MTTWILVLHSSNWVPGLGQPRLRLSMAVRAVCLLEEAGELFHPFALSWGHPLGLRTCSAV